MRTTTRTVRTTMSGGKSRKPGSTCGECYIGDADAFKITDAAEFCAGVHRALANAVTDAPVEEPEHEHEGGCGEAGCVVCNGAIGRVLRGEGGAVFAMVMERLSEAAQVDREQLRMMTLQAEEAKLVLDMIFAAGPVIDGVRFTPSMPAVDLKRMVVVELVHWMDARTGNENYEEAARSAGYVEVPVIALGPDHAVGEPGYGCMACDYTILGISPREAGHDAMLDHFATAPEWQQRCWAHDNREVLAAAEARGQLNRYSEYVQEEYLRTKGRRRRRPQGRSRG
jgi:hypothetical protein